MSNNLVIESPAVWEEKNLTEPKKKSESNGEIGQADIITDIKKNVIKKEWRGIGKKKEISGIYKIINKINGKYYVGSSNDIRRRWRSHRFLLLNDKHNSTHLQNSWNKYGPEAFDFVIVEENISDQELLIKEQKYLDIGKNEKEKCFNLSYIAGKIEMTTEVINKIIKSNKNRTCSKEQKEKLSIANRNKTIYNFKNIKSGEIFSGMMYDFKIKTKIGHSNLYRLMNGELKQLNGWIFIKP